MMRSVNILWEMISFLRDSTNLHIAGTLGDPGRGEAAL